MRASRDRADQAGPAEQPPRWSAAELRQRLEHLPPGHPSSPRNADGSRRPPVTSLRALELPLPAQQDAPASDRPHVSEDGTWRWKGLSLTPEQNRAATRAHEQFTALEGREPSGGYADNALTPAMRRIEADLEHGRLEGCPEFSLKSEDRFKEKLARMIAAEPGASAEDLAASIHDAVRYTFTFDAERYVDGIRETRGRLEDQGHELRMLRNTWHHDEYKGVNTRWRHAETGLSFEVQFHTPESWAVKQRTHHAYEKIASQDTLTTERERLRAYQRELCATVSLPSGLAEIEDYRKDG